MKVMYIVYVVICNPLLLTREWYSYHFPELIKIVPDNQLYARVAHYVGDRKTLNDERLEGLEELVMDSTKAQSIMEAARMSMGNDSGTRQCHLI